MLVTLAWSDLTRRWRGLWARRRLANVGGDDLATPMRINHVCGNVYTRLRRLFCIASFVGLIVDMDFAHVLEPLSLLP